MITMKFETLDDFERQLYDFKILFAYHSGKIENDDITYHDTKEIFEDGRIVGYTGSLKTLFEIENPIFSNTTSCQNLKKVSLSPVCKPTLGCIISDRVFPENAKKSFLLREYAIGEPGIFEKSSCVLS